MPYKDSHKQKKAQHEHYLKNKDHYKTAAKKSRPRYYKNRSLWMQKLKADLTCKKCGEDRFPCLDFHHRDPTEKEMNIAAAVWRMSKLKVLEEIKKCDVLCRNCHAMLHWKENNKNS